MRKIMIPVVFGLLVAAACTKTTPPLPPPVPVGSVPPATTEPSPGEEIPEGTIVINGCAIVADTDCPEVDLSRSQLPGSDLRRANLAGGNLSGSDLRRIDFTGANLSSTKIRNSDLTGANLTDADLTGAVLKFTNVTSANLTGTGLVRSDLAKLTLCKTILPDGRRDDSGCPQNPGTSTDPADSGPTIVSFTVDGSPVKCSGTLTTVSLTVKWETKRAKTVTFEENDKPLAGDQTFSPSGDDIFEYPCKKAQVVYKLVAADSAGLETQREVTVERA